MESYMNFDSTLNKNVSFLVYSKYHKSRRREENKTKQNVTFRLRDVLLSASDMFDLYRLATCNLYDIGSPFRDTAQMIRFTRSIVNYDNLNSRSNDLRVCLQHVTETWNGIGHKNINATLEQVRRENAVEDARFRIGATTIKAIGDILRWLLDRDGIYHRYQAVFHMNESIQWSRKMPAISTELYDDFNIDYIHFITGLIYSYGMMLEPPGSECERLVLLYARIRQTVRAKSVNVVAGAMDATILLQHDLSLDRPRWTLLEPTRIVYAAVLHYTKYMIGVWKGEYDRPIPEMLAISEKRKAVDQKGKELGIRDFRDDFMDWLKEMGMHEAIKVMTTEPAFCSESYKAFKPWTLFKRFIYMAIEKNTRRIFPRSVLDSIPCHTKLTFKAYTKKNNNNNKNHARPHKMRKKK